MCVQRTNCVLLFVEAWHKSIACVGGVTCLQAVPFNHFVRIVPFAGRCKLDIPSFSPLELCCK